jgi:cyclopropane fatty-acyl-phospholipid synthase-like methyltransferase
VGGSGGFGGHDGSLSAANFAKVMAGISSLYNLDMQCTLVDLGCGLGRVLAQAAATFPLGRVFGVELPDTIRDSNAAFLPLVFKALMRDGLLAEAEFTMP